MMHIEKLEQGWTVLDDSGQVRLQTKDGQPMYLSSEAEVVAQCTANGAYRARRDNPGGWPEGTLLVFSIDPAPADVPSP